VVYSRNRKRADRSRDSEGVTETRLERKGEPRP
jgi:hypothetical protein